MKDKNDVFHLGVAVSDQPEGPFIPQANPIKGSYSIDPCAFKDKWYLFHHDSKPSGGRTWLRSLKVIGLEYLPDGSIKTIPGQQ